MRTEQKPEEKDQGQEAIATCTAHNLSILSKNWCVQDYNRVSKMSGHAHIRKDNVEIEKKNMEDD